MCSEFEQDPKPKDLVIRFELVELPPQINMAFIRPTDQALIIGMNKQPMLCGWGFEVTWDTKPLINARSETLAEKQSFQPHLETRCIVPATGYSEWRKEDDKKLKNRIHPSDQPLFSMAGLIKDNKFTIITCQPSPEIAYIHNRMPVILAPEAEKSWLDPSNTFNAVAHHLVPYDRALMTAKEDKPPPPPPRELVWVRRFYFIKVGVVKFRLYRRKGIRHHHRAKRHGKPFSRRYRFFRRQISRVLILKPR